jgi:hypothetical protein
MCLREKRAIRQVLVAREEVQPTEWGGETVSCFAETTESQ